MRNEARFSVIETAKSIALVALVALSVILSGEIWGAFRRPILGARSPEPAGADAPGTGRPLALAEVVCPTDLVFGIAGASGDLHWVGCSYGTPAFRRLWGKGGLLSGAALEVSTEAPLAGASPSRSSASPGETPEVLEMILPPGISPLSFARSCGYAALADALPEDLPARGGAWRLSLAVSRDPEKPVHLTVIAPDGAVCATFALKGQESSTRAALDEARALSLGPPADPASRLVGYSYLPPGEFLAAGVWVPEDAFRFEWPFAVAVEEVSPDIIGSAFFAEPAFVRSIEEIDGAVIYTDGRRGVRVYPTGLVEYALAGGAFGEAADQEVDPPDALRELSFCMAFVESRGGWPEGALLTRHSPGPGRTELAFSWYHEGNEVGLPVPALALVLSRGEVAEYTRANLRAVRTASDEPFGELVGASAALKACREAGHAARVVSLRPVWRVESLPVAGQPARAVPAWRLGFEDGGEAWVDARTRAVSR